MGFFDDPFQTKNPKSILYNAGKSSDWLGNAIEVARVTQENKRKKEQEREDLERLMAEESGSGGKFMPTRRGKVADAAEVVKQGVVSLADNEASQYGPADPFVRWATDPGNLVNVLRMGGGVTPDKIRDNPGKVLKDLYGQDDTVTGLINNASKPVFDRKSGKWIENPDAATERAAGISKLRENFSRLGMDDDAISSAIEYLGVAGEDINTPGGKPINQAVSKLFGGGFVGNLAGEVVGTTIIAAPVVGPTLYGINKGLDEGKRDASLVEVAEVGADALVMSKMVNLAEDGIANAVLKKVGKESAEGIAKTIVTEVTAALKGEAVQASTAGVKRELLKRGASVATRALINLSEDLPLTALQLHLAGIEPGTPEWNAVMLEVTKMSAAGGAVLGSVSGAPSGVKRPVVEGAVTSGATYAGSQLGGASDEQSLKNAAMAGGGLVALRAASRFTPVSGSKMAIHPDVAPVWGSKLRDTVDQKMPAKASIDQVRGIVRSSGIKEDELEWSGFNEWLDSKSASGKSLTKAEVLGFLDDHDLPINEVVLSGGESSRDSLDFSDPIGIDRQRDDFDTNDDYESWLDTGEYDEFSSSSSDGRFFINGSNDVGWELYDTVTGESTDHRYFYNATGEARDIVEGEAGPSSRYDEYRTPGSDEESYRELVITLPKLPQSDADSNALAKAKAARLALSEERVKGTDDRKRSALTPGEVDSLYARMEELDKEIYRLERDGRVFGQYDAGDRNLYHWGDDAGGVVHIRFDERRGENGERVLFVNEIQSDWHQLADKIGYFGDRPVVRAETRMENGTPVEYVIPDGAPKGEAGTEWAVDYGFAVKTGSEPYAAAEKLRQRIGYAQPPRAPFAKSWDELALKRVVRWAADNGFDAVALARGEMLDEIDGFGGANAGRAKFYDAKLPTVLAKVAKQSGLTSDGAVRHGPDTRGNASPDDVRMEMERFARGEGVTPEQAVLAREIMAEYARRIADNEPQVYGFLEDAVQSVQLRLNDADRANGRWNNSRLALNVFQSAIEAARKTIPGTGPGVRLSPEDRQRISSKPMNKWLVPQEGSAPQGGSLGRTALQAGGAAAGGFLTADGSTEDRLKAAAGGAVSSLVGGKFGMKTVGDVASSAARNSGQQSPKNTRPYGPFLPQQGPQLTAYQRYILNQKNAQGPTLTRAQRAALNKANAALKPPPAPKPSLPPLTHQSPIGPLIGMSNKQIRVIQSASTPAQSAAAKATIDRFTSKAQTQVADPHVAAAFMRRIGLEDAVKRAGGLFNPASVINSIEGKLVLASTVAAANYSAFARVSENARARAFIRGLDSLTGGTGRLQAPKQAAGQLAAGAAVAGAGYVAEDATGIDGLGEAGVIAGLAAVGGVSRRQRSNKWANRRWESVVYKGNTSQLPDDLKSGKGKLYDILQRPEEYLLSSEQIKQVSDYMDARKTMIRETNAFIEHAGGSPILFIDHHGLLQWFEQKSLDKAFPNAKRQGLGAESKLTPGFSRKQAPQLGRRVGDTYFEALSNHPDLKLINDPEQLFTLEQRFHDQIRAQAILVAGIKNHPDSFKFTPIDQQKSWTSAQKKAQEAKLKALRDAGWQQLPGIDNTYFHPNVIDTVEQLLLPTRGRDGAMGLADGVTNVLRQAMFTGDLSAWSMQGAMAAIEDPVGVILNAPHLIGATVIGKRYFEHWRTKNSDLWEEFVASGGVPGFEHQGLEKDGLSLSRVPVIRHIEERGFEAFLPMHRAMMWKNLTQQEAFIRRAGWGGDKLGPKRATFEAAKIGPGVAGAFAVGTDNEIEFTGNETLDNLLTLALGFSVNVGTRVGAGKLAGRVAAEDIDKVNAAKHTNRISGAFNRQQYGISSKQAQAERVLGARSPALLKNTIILAQRAATDFGPQGAMARYYLIKTATLMGIAFAAAQQFAGEEGAPSFNPTDSDSIFNPLNKNFMRANGGKIGTLSGSNPIISLVKAFVRTDNPVGEQKWRFENWDPVLGLRDWYAGRAPDLFGSFVSVPAMESFLIPDDIVNNPVDKFPGLQDSSIENRGKIKWRGPEVSLPVPLVGRAAFETGLAQQTVAGKLIQPVTDALGLEKDRGYSNRKEAIMGALGSFLGLNTNPQSLGAEAIQIKQQEFEQLAQEFPELFPNGAVLDYQNSDTLQRRALNRKLENNKRYEEIQAQYDADGEGTPTPVTALFSSLEKREEEYLAAAEDLSTRYENGAISPFYAREAFNALREDFYNDIATLRKDNGSVAVQIRGIDMTVSEYLKRNAPPRDLLLDEWYALSDKAFVDGTLDFDKLEEMRTELLKKAPDADREYVLAATAAFGSDTEPTKLGRDYDRVKEVTKPYFELRDTVFDEMQGKGVFGQFSTFNELSKAVDALALRSGVRPDDVWNALAKEPEMRKFNAVLDKRQKALRIADKELEEYLVQWHERAPLKAGKIGSAFGGSSSAFGGMASAFGNVRAEALPFSLADLK